MAKITIMSIFPVGAGTIYCAGLVNGKYINFLTEKQLNNKDIKKKLLEYYNKRYNVEEKCYE